METTETVGTEAEATQQGTSQEYVDLHEASDEDLNAFLEGANEPETAPVPEQPQADPGDKKETKSEQPEQEPEVEPNISKQDFERMQKQLDGMELLIKRRTSELAEVKKQLRDFVDKTQQNLDEQWLESPTQAYANMRKIEMAQEQLKQAEAEEQALTNTHQAQVLLAHHVGADNFDVEAIGQSLLSDGLPEEFVQTFVTNPYQAALPETLIQLSKRAVAEKKVRELEAALQQIVPYTQKLLEEKKAAPQNVLKNVSSALRQSPQITGSAGGTGQPTGGRVVEPSLMSDVELEEFLKSK